jgi:hypothetical protein
MSGTGERSSGAAAARRTLADHTVRAALCATVAAAAVAACGGGKTGATDTARPGGGTSSAAPVADSSAAPSGRGTTAAAVPSANGAARQIATPAASDTTCPMWGNWRECSVVYRLTRAGLDVKRRDAPVRHPFLSVPGTVYEVRNAEIEVFLYPSASDRARDTEALDSATVAPHGQPVVWRDPPTLVTSNNLAAIVLSPNDRQSERIALALGAGMPLDPPRRE